MRQNVHQIFTICCLVIGHLVVHVPQVAIAIDRAIPPFVGKATLNHRCCRSKSILFLMTSDIDDAR